MTSTTINLPFDGVPLFRELTMTAAEVSGEAEITVWNHNDWSITGIALDTLINGKVTPFAELDRGSWLFTAIHSELEAHWKDQIEDRIADLVNERV